MTNTFSYENINDAYIELDYDEALRESTDLMRAEQIITAAREVRNGVRGAEVWYVDFSLATDAARHVSAWWQAAGFFLESTGGNCTAFSREFKDGDDGETSRILVTGCDGSAIPDDLDEPCIVGFETLSEQGVSFDVANSQAAIDLIRSSSWNWEDGEGVAPIGELR